MWRNLQIRYFAQTVRRAFLHLFSIPKGPNTSWEGERVFISPKPWKMLGVLFWCLLYRMNASRNRFVSALIVLVPEAVRHFKEHTIQQNRDTCNRCLGLLGRLTSNWLCVSVFLYWHRRSTVCYWHMRTLLLLRCHHNLIEGDLCQTNEQWPNHFRPMPSTPQGLNPMGTVGPMGPVGGPHPAANQKKGPKGSWDCMGSKGGRPKRGPELSQSAQRAQEGYTCLCSPCAKLRDPEYVLKVELLSTSWKGHLAFAENKKHVFFVFFSRGGGGCVHFVLNI